MEHSPTSSRLVSLDALRGFDMFWILGMEQVAQESKATLDLLFH